MAGVPNLKFAACYSCNFLIPTREESVEYEGKVFCSDECIADFIDAPSDLWEDDESYLVDGVGFADPGGRSALRAETPSNPRNLPCPQCGRENMLTPLDRRAGYRCDLCADAAEFGLEW